MPVSNQAELDALLVRVKAAQRKFATFSQEQVDLIFRSAALAAADARIPLAKMAVEETRMGILEDKVIKNHFASEYIYNKYKDEKTCGVLEENPEYGTMKIAEPVGIICGIVPTTNPTSTAIFKALIALKTRNAIVFSPHPRAKKATCFAAKLVLDAAIAAGAPKDIIGWIDEPSVELSNALMRHQDINLILATGGPGMVKAAYSSGTPAIGVGAGNTPAVIDETADIKRAVASILMSKTFDNGVICASEQSVVVVDEVYDAVRERFSHHGGYILSKKETEAVAQDHPRRWPPERRDRRSIRDQDRRDGWRHRSALHQGAARRGHQRRRIRSFRARKAVPDPRPVPRQGFRGCHRKGRALWSRWAVSVTPRCSTPTRICSRNASATSATR